MAHREGEHRRRQRVRQQDGLHARGRQDGGRVRGEGGRTASRVVPDDGQRRGSVPSDAVPQVGGQTRRGATHHEPVHAGLARALLGAQAGGAEGERPGEAGGERRPGGRGLRADAGGRVELGAQGVPVRGVGVLRRPPLSPGEDVLRERGDVVVRGMRGHQSRPTMSASRRAMRGPAA